MRTRARIMCAASRRGWASISISWSRRRLYLTSDPTIDSQMVAMRESGADVFFAEATPKFAAQAIKNAATVGGKPLITLPSISTSFSAVLEPPGIDNAVGVVTGLYLKDPNDIRWADD